MKAKHQRLTLALLAVGALVGSGLLAASALKDEAAYFYAPGDIARAQISSGQNFRLGGMVKPGSVMRAPDGVSIAFTVTDNQAAVPVRFRGIVPDLFKEGSGVIAEGALDANGEFVASNILAKHDERYMPPELAGTQHKTGKVQ